MSLLENTPAGNKERDAFEVGGRFRYSLKSLLVATAVLAVFTVLMKAAWSRAQASAFEGQVRNNFKTTWLGVLNYESARIVRIPPVFRDANGNALSSWRFQVLPYMDQLGRPVRWDFKADWRAPANAYFSSARLDVFCWTRDKGAKDTNLFAIVGTDAAFTESPVRNAKALPNNVIALMEVVDSKTHWMQPGDYNVAGLLAATGNLGDTVHGVLNDRIHVLFADGEVWALSPKTPMDALKPFLTITAAKSANREALAAYRVD